MTHRRPERERLVGQINYWQAIKWQGRFNEVLQSVQDADYSAKDELYSLAQFALLGNADVFFDLLPRVLKAEKLSLDDLRAWPLFRKKAAHPY